MIVAAEKGFNLAQDLSPNILLLVENVVLHHHKNVLAWATDAQRNTKNTKVRLLVRTESYISLAYIVQDNYPINHIFKLNYQNEHENVTLK